MVACLSLYKVKEGLPARHWRVAARRGAIVCEVVPLAVSGKLVIGTAVIFAIVLLVLLFRMEDRDEAREKAEAEKTKR